MVLLTAKRCLANSDPLSRFRPAYLIERYACLGLGGLLGNPGLDNYYIHILLNKMPNKLFINL